MCTVVYFPNKHTPCFASLRDESPKRPSAHAPQLFEEQGINYLMPMDALAGGTWIGVNEYSNVIILLNGAFQNHERKTSYAKSRGIIVRELLASITPVVDWQLMNLENIEPFTLVVWSENNLFELVWDGQTKHRQRMDASVPHIWSSSTLYNPQAKLKRSDAFQNWLVMQPHISKLSVLQFFNSFSDSENGFIINRNDKMKTLSYSFVELSNKTNSQLDYYDLQNYTRTAITIELIRANDSCMMESYSSKIN